MFLLKPLKTDYLLLRQVNDRSYELMNEILLLKLAIMGKKMLNAKNKMLFSTLISMLFPVLTTQYICKNSEKKLYITCVTLCQ